jgi:hypothetical protein
MALSFAAQFHPLWLTMICCTNGQETCADASQLADTPCDRSVAMNLKPFEVQLWDLRAR